jgi:hypothetical protein
MSARYQHRSSVLIFCVLVWYATIAILTFPWALLMLELAFGFLLWRSQARAANVVTSMGKAC